MRITAAVLFILIYALNFAGADDYYKSKEAIFLADRYLLFQRDTGGWPKEDGAVYNMKGKLTNEEIKLVKQAKSNKNDSTIDNNATTSQMIYLAKVYNAVKTKKYLESFMRGLEYLLKAQYESGGWPQYYPLIGDYHDLITYNDNAIISVLRLLKDIFADNSIYDFVPADLKEKCRISYNKGIDCILKSQIEVNGKLTAWCQQHDPVTLKAAWGRNFEPISICSQESVNIIKFLMLIDKPDERIINAVQSAAAWFDGSKIFGIKIVKKQDKTKSKGFDTVAEKDSASGPVWSRFYEIETNKPIFVDRNKKVYYDFNENEYERRTGYSWYNGDALSLLNKSYPAWQIKWAPDKNVLTK